MVSIQSRLGQALNAAILAVAITSPASSMTAGELVDACQTAFDFNGGRCLGFFEALADSLLDGTCIPADVTLFQAKDRAVAYLQENKELLDNQAVVSTLWALLQTFPCEEE